MSANWCDGDSTAEQIFMSALLISGGMGWNNCGGREAGGGKV